MRGLSMLQTSASTPGRIDTRTNKGEGKQHSIRPAAFQNIHFLYKLSLTAAQTHNTLILHHCGCHRNIESEDVTDSDADFWRHRFEDGDTLQKSSFYRTGACLSLRQALIHADIMTFASQATQLIHWQVCSTWRRVADLSGGEKSKTQSHTAIWGRGTSLRTRVATELRKKIAQHGAGTPSTITQAFRRIENTAPLHLPTTLLLLLLLLFQSQTSK